MSNPLSTRAMLIRLKLTGWSARKLDRKITDEVNRDHGAADDAGRYNKLLLAPEALAEIGKHDTATRDYFYRVTSPWHDEGTRILSTALSLETLNHLRVRRQERDSLVRSFVAGYPAYVESARTRLNGMFNPADYPPADIVATRFQFATAIDKVPESGDFRIDLADGQADDIRREIEERATAAANLVTRDCFARVAEYVGRMAERLKAYKPAENPGDKSQGVFRDSLVENVRDLCALLPKLNITGDPALTAIAARMESLIRDDAATLRENATVRASVAAEAESIVADVSQYLA
jgi:hypothetical protein